MARLVSGGRGNGIANITRIVTGSGALLTLQRLLGAGSTLALQTGSHPNLSCRVSVSQRRYRSSPAKPRLREFGRLPVPARRSGRPSTP
ncbi:hypothetical protein ACFSHP_05430 [Novosphingobium panipatense]